MTAAAVSAHIAHVAVADLRVGMYVHLEGGWLAHPFPLSNFKLASAAQIATLRTLRLERVRWSPELSDLPGAASGGAPATGAPSDAAAEPLTAAAFPIDPAHAAREARKAALAAQRADLARCERRFAEAAQACRAACERVVADPRAAGAQCAALAQAFAARIDRKSTV